MVNPIVLNVGFVCVILLFAAFFVLSRMLAKWATLVEWKTPSSYPDKDTHVSSDIESGTTTNAGDAAPIESETTTNAGDASPIESGTTTNAGDASPVSLSPVDDVRRSEVSETEISASSSYGSSYIDFLLHDIEMFRLKAQTLSA